MGVVAVRRAGTALYAQVEAHIERAIASGGFPVGALLPAEATLQKDYGVSKFTIREALRRLEAAGLVQKRHGVGTCVIAKTRESTSTFAIDDIDDFIRLAYRARLTKLVIKRRRPRAHEANAFGIELEDTYFLTSGVRKLPGASSATAWVKVFVPQKYGDVLKHVRGNSHLISDLIEEHLGVSTSVIRQEIAAARIDLETQGEVKKAGIAMSSERALVFRRWHIDHSGGLIICSENIFFDPDFSFNFTLSRRTPETRARRGDADGESRATRWDKEARNA